MTNTTPKYSIIHTTARPKEWARAYNAWMREAVHPEDIEYILVVDTRWGFPDHAEAEIVADTRSYGNLLRVVYNRQRKCMVDGYNVGAAYARGKVLILNSDDMRPCPSWDLALDDIQMSAGKDGIQHDFVIQVSSGTAADARGLMVLQILSARRYYLREFALYPGYLSMYADDDFSEEARANEVVLDARHLLFRHEHPEVHTDLEGLDPVYRHQNSGLAYELGAKLLDLRRSMGFFTSQMPSLKQHPKPVRDGNRQRTVAICVPGDHFSGIWVSNVIGLYSKLVTAGYGVHTLMNYSSNVYITRTCILEGLKAISPAPDYILWLDDDNIINFEQVQMLMADLDAWEQVDIVAGWCWIQPDGYQIKPLTSCGYLGEGFSGDHVTGEALQNAKGLVKVDFTGFPAVMMKPSVIADLEPSAFAPLPAPGNRWGYTGEDVSFCINAAKAGHEVFVDARVQVPHMKLRNAVPNMPGTTTAVEV